MYRESDAADAADANDANAADAAVPRDAESRKSRALQGRCAVQPLRMVGMGMMMGNMLRG